MNAHIPKANVPPAFEHRSLQHHYTKSHIEKYRGSAVQAQYHFTISHMDIASLSHCNYVIGPPGNQPYISWTPLHQINVTYRRLHIYPWHMYKLRYLMRKVVVCNYYECVIIHQIDSVRICVNWSVEKIVHIKLLNIVCNNM